MVPQSIRLAALLLTAAILAATSAAAQTNLGEPRDITISIVDGTTGGPGRAERLTIEYLTGRNNLVLDIEPDGAELVLRDVPLYDKGRYVVTVHAGGVPYFFSRKGEQLAGEPQSYMVFATTEATDGVSIQGMNLVLKREESLLQVEAMLQVMNASSPPVAVTAPGGSFALDLPAALTGIHAEYHRALDPTPVAAARRDGGWGIAAPLVPGLNRVRITGALPWREGLEMTVGSDLPIDSWSVLVSPDWSEVTSFELEPDADTAIPGYKRLVGPPLEAGRTLAMRLGSGEGQTGEVENVFTEPASAEPAAPAPQPERDKGGLPLPILVLVGIVLLLLVIRRRRG